MQLELKNIKHSEFASEETNCYQASLYVDGKPMFQVSNDGKGGSDDIHAFGNKKWADVVDTYLNVVEYCKTLPKCSYDAGNGITKYYDKDIDIVCGDILTKWLIKKDMKRAFKTKLFFKKNPKEKGLFTYKIGKHPKKVIIDHCTKNYPQAIILNTLPENNALELWNNN